MVIRPATMDDAEAVAQLRHVVMPYQVVTAAGLRHIWETMAPAARLLVLVAEVNGEVVASGRANLNTWTSEEGAASLVLMVHPDFAGQGIGSRMLDDYLDHLRDVGGRKVEAWGIDDPQVRAWCEKRGWQRGHELRFSRLDLSDVDALPPSPPVPDDVTTMTYAEAGPEVVYEVDAATMRDEPGENPLDAVSYDEWLNDAWRFPGVDLEASTLVLVDGVPAAMTTIDSDPSRQCVWSGGTGTLREFRGRQLAKVAKSIALRRAARAGITDAYTSNDELNKPMLAVNEWLGYKPCATQWSYTKRL